MNHYVSVADRQWLIFALTIICHVALYFLLPFLEKKHKLRLEHLAEQDRRFRQLTSDNEVLYKQGLKTLQTLTEKAPTNEKKL